ncbi:MAG: RidA family protein [Campylobacter sp.]|nr:RidA family protein [Campylobacter sp.]
MKVISTNKAPAAIGPYSQAVMANGFVFVSGQIPLTSDGEFVKGGIETQTKQVLQNLGEILKEAGTSFDKVVKTTIFLADMGNFGVVNEIYAKVFSTHKPARSTVAIKTLPKDALIEIEVIAKVN